MKDKKLAAANRFKYYSHSLFYRLSGRTAFLLNMLEVTFVLIYVAGNFQGFLDSSQTKIIFISILVSIPGLIFNILSLVINIVYMFTYKRPIFILHFFAFLLGIILQTAILIVFSLLKFISQGLV